MLNITRLATRDTEVGGVAIPAGSTVMLMLAAANREEDRWDEPDEFDLARDEPKPHIAFGQGPHMCLGMHLARMEMRVALNIVLDRLPGLRLDPNRATTRTSADRCSAHRRPYRCCSDENASLSDQRHTPRKEEYGTCNHDGQVIAPRSW